jgi:hypothetical protein
LEAHVLTLPKIKAFGEEYDQTLDTFITGLVSEYEFYRDLRKRCKKQWVFKLKKGTLVGYPKTYAREKLEQHISLVDKNLGCVNDNMEGVYEWLMSQEDGKRPPLL